MASAPQAVRNVVWRMVRAWKKDQRSAASTPREDGDEQRDALVATVLDMGVSGFELPVIR